MRKVELTLVGIIGLSVLVLLWPALKAKLGPASRQVSTIVQANEHTLVDPVILAAGDISSCSNNFDQQTADVVKARPGTVLTLGDHVYNLGTDLEFERCYDPTWGAFKERTKPSPGNHDYATSKAKGYFDYFGRAAGDPARGYYSFNLGSWHLISLNSNCGSIGGCDESSTQGKWLAEDIAAHPNVCTFAYFHHPPFSSGQHGGTQEGLRLWKQLVAADVDLVLAGHDHIYERFNLIDQSGQADPDGTQLFIVGTGGRSHYALGRRHSQSAVIETKTYGVLSVTLRPGKYDYMFLPIDGQSFSDTGQGVCS